MRFDPKDLALVDDNEVFIERLKQAVGSSTTVHGFNAPEELIAALNRGLTLDAAVIDYRLQGMDGFELCHEIRSKLGSIPLVIMSAHADGILAEKLCEYGISGFLQKPFHIDRFVLVVRKAHVRHVMDRLLRQRMGLNAALVRVMKALAATTEDEADIAANLARDRGVESPEWLHELHALHEEMRRITDDLARLHDKEEQAREAFRLIQNGATAGDALP